MANLSNFHLQICMQYPKSENSILSLIDWLHSNLEEVFFIIILDFVGTKFFQV